MLYESKRHCADRTRALENSSENPSCHFNTHVRLKVAHCIRKIRMRVCGAYTSCDTPNMQNEQPIKYYFTPTLYCLFLTVG